MTYTVIASGDSAKDWVRRGTAIGVNDCLKFGRDTDILILVNAPGKFKERLNVIKKSKAKVLTNSVSMWKPYFPQCQKIERLISFNSKILKNFVYMSQTSPIIALSLAIKMGATEIIMWGVDFLTHKKWAKGTKAGDREVRVYEKFFKECERIGVKVYLGANGTAFDGVLPVYPTGEPYWPKYPVTQEAYNEALSVLIKRAEGRKPEEMK